MSERKLDVLISDESISNKIYLIRNQNVLLDRDLAKLYDVETKVLKQAVKRNIRRFPEDFMFILSQSEANALRSQIVTLKRGEHSKYLPAAFTEQGVAMLSSVLNSEKAIQINIQIIRIFTKIRQFLVNNAELRLAVEEIRKKTENNSKNIELVFQYLDELLDQKTSKEPRKLIGFSVPKK